MIRAEGAHRPPGPPVDLPDEASAGEPGAVGTGPLMFRSRRAQFAKDFAWPVLVVPADAGAAPSPFWQGFRWGLIGSAVLALGTVVVVLAAHLARLMVGGAG